MIKYSPSNSKTVKLDVNSSKGVAGVCRFIRTGTPYISRQYFSVTWSDSNLYGGWMVFLSDKTPEEIESMVSAGDYSFETVKSHGNEFAYYSNDNIIDISDKIQYNQEGSPTFNFGKMLGVDPLIAYSSNGNGGVFMATTGFTCKTVGIKFIGHVWSGTTNSKQSESFFLFTVGDKDSLAEVKIHNPVLQAGDTVDLSDLTLTIQVPLEVE